MADREFVIGIDLGTTNSVVATVQGKQPVVVKSRAGANLTPSLVAVSAAGKRLVGLLAKRQAVTNAQETVYASKRLIGRKFSSPQVKEAMRHLGYQVVCGEHDDVRVKLGGRDVALPEISAMILRELKADAEAYAGSTVTKAVITVPAFFNDGQRQATKDAGVIAGLDVLRIINEPTAAALAYGFGKSLTGKLAVFDLGGGTFDISVLQVEDGVFEVIATGGDTFLGGEDFDNRIIDWLVMGFGQEHHLDLRQDRMALQRLKDAAEKAKIELSTALETKISLPFISSPAATGPALHLHVFLTRQKLEELTADLTKKTISLCDQVMRDARVKPADLKEMILVGGMTRMPKIVEAAKGYFQREPCTGVNPDEVVALGAAVQAAALTEESNVVLLDVTPMSLGVAVAGGYVRRLIPKNTTVPTSVTELFNTSKDSQTTVKIVVIQGEHELAHQNELLGEFTLTGLREARRGEVVVEVTFEISSEGLVSVSARDKETGREQSITVNASGGLTRTELVNIMDSHADELLEARSTDELASRRAALGEVLKEVQQLIPEVKKISEQTGFGADAVTRGQGMVEVAKQALEAGNLAAVSGSIDALTRAVTLFKTVIARFGATRPPG